MYDRCDLNNTINKAYSNGLITEGQKKQLDGFRRDYRNPYSHAESAKIFGDSKVKGKPISLKDGENSNTLLTRIFEPMTTELPVKDFLPIQGIAQVILAKEISIPYFSEVDKIIRNMLTKLRTDKRS